MQHREQSDNKMLELEQAYSEWLADWIAYFQSEDAVETFATDLLERWEGDVPDEGPLDLPVDPLNLDSQYWSNSLEIFLLDEQRKDASEITAKIIEGFNSAVAVFRPDFSKGFVWYADLLALRRAVWSVDTDAENSVLELLLTALGKACEVYPDSTLDDYQTYGDILREVSDCLVAELYEPEAFEQAHTGSSGYNRVTTFSTFFLLERGRLLSAEASVSAEDNPAMSDQAIVLPTRYVNDDIVLRFQAAIDNLYETLLVLNAQALKIDDAETELAEFRRIADRVAKKSPSAVEDKARFVNLQRSLDIHWLRLAHVVSPHLQEEASSVRAFIQMMAREDKAYALEVERCGLQESSLLVPKPTRPGVGMLRLVSDNEDNIIFDLDFSSEIAGRIRSVGVSEPRSAAG